MLLIPPPPLVHTFEFQQFRWWTQGHLQVFTCPRSQSSSFSPMFTSNVGDTQNWRVMNSFDGSFSGLSRGLKPPACSGCPHQSFQLTVAFLQDHNTTRQFGETGTSWSLQSSPFMSPAGSNVGHGFTLWKLETLQGGRWHHLPWALLSRWGKLSLHCSLYPCSAHCTRLRACSHSCHSPIGVAAGALPAQDCTMLLSSGSGDPCAFLSLAQVTLVSSSL